jgi:hypothetical protein
MARNVVQVARMLLATRIPHPLSHHASYRAVLAAAAPLAELVFRIKRRPQATDLVAALAVACGDLADGFASPPDSRRRLRAHHRAWVAVRDIDRAVVTAGKQRLAPTDVVQRAQRAIDRADVLIGALLPT